MPAASGNTGSTFSINPTNGLLSLAKTTGITAQSTFSLLRYVQDANVPCLNGQQSVIISFYDDTDRPPVFNPLTYSVNFTEFTGPGYQSRRRSPFPYLLTTVHATSNNVGANAQFSYFLYSGNPQYFSINPTTGQVYALQNLAYSVAPSWTVVVGAMTVGGATTDDTTSATVNIKVIQAITDVYFTLPGPFMASAPSASLAGVNVITLGLTNPDRLSYKCSISDPSNNFATANGTNLCIVYTNRTLTNQVDTTYQVTVTVTDQLQVSDGVVVNILFVSWQPCRCCSLPCSACRRSRPACPCSTPAS